NTDTLTINGTAITGLGSDSSGAITGGHSYSYTQATGMVTITFVGSTNAAEAELVLENITYGIDASDQDPSATVRTVTLNTVTDNGGGADTNTDISETATISVGAVNDAPTFSVGDGIAITAVGPSFDNGQSVAVQSDGKILVAGDSDAGTSWDFALTRYNSDGTLDTSFGGGDGIVTTDIVSLEDQGRSVALQSDGKILVAGYTDNGGDADFALIRYNSDGTLDASFGGGDGIVTTAVGGSHEYGQSVTLQADGKILVAGQTSNGLNYDFALTRYHSDGTLDTSFGGGDGIVTTGVGAGDDNGESVAVQSDGKIVVAGYSHNGSDRDFALTRYNSDGTLDTSFGGGDGRVTTDFGSGHDRGHSVSVQSDGKIVVAGDSHNGSDYDFALTRYNSDGTLDTSFGGGDGMLTSAIGAGHDYGWSIIARSDGKLLVAGHSHNGTDNDFTVTRYDSDGTLDASFGGGDGIVTADSGGGFDYAFSMALQLDGKILVAGSSSIGFNYDSALVRFNADGTLDTSFDPVNTLNGTPTFTEGGPAVVLDADVDVSDSELDALNSGNGDYHGASVTLGRNGGVSTEDVFSFSDGNGISLVGGTVLQKAGATIANFNITTTPGQLVITFTNANGQTPTSSDVDNILRQITYSNSSDDPLASAQIDWSFDDGNTGSQGTGGALQATGSITVAITQINDTPTLAATAANDSLTENTDTTSAAIFSTVTIDPIESGDYMASAQLTLGGGIENTDTLTINGTAITALGSDSSGAITGGHSYSYTQATGVVTITFAGSTNAA
ncbi:MAG: hypothetical protein GY717_18815, partial [Rhodobacteraceae bacterium]|nr:hypothetical protein [Paracoccaceae bacterium]